VDVIFEHRAYLASWGIIAAFVVTVDATVGRINIDKTKLRRIAALVIAVVMTSMALNLHARTEVWRDKLSLWSDVVKKSPYKARPHMNLGHALGLEGRYEEAVREYNIALRFSGDRSATPAEILRNLGVVKFRLGQLAEAVGIFRQVLVFEPENMDILNNLSICLLETGRNDEALSTALRAEGVNPRHGGINSTLGEIYLSDNQHSKALGYFRKALKLNPDVPVRYYNAALVLEKMGQLSEACSYWEQYLSMEKSAEEGRLVYEHMAEIACP
jgi:tetratricopeptide (TPR) repeat protein